MLYNGEQIGDGSPTAHRHRRRPDRRHHADRAGPGQRPRRHRRVRAGHDVRPRPVRLHGEDRRRPRGRRASSTSGGSPTENLEAVAKAKGTSRPRRHRGHPRPRPPHRPHRRGALDRRPHPPHPRRRRGRRHLDRLARLGRRHPVRHRRHARGRHRRRRAQVHGRRAAGPAVAPQRRRAARRPSTPATTSTQVLTTDDLVTGDNCFFAATGITDGELLKGVHFTRRDGATTQSLVMRSKSGTVRLVNAQHQLSKLAGVLVHRLRLTRPPPRFPRGSGRRSDQIHGRNPSGAVHMRLATLAATQRLSPRGAGRGRHHDLVEAAGHQPRPAVPGGVEGRRRHVVGDLPGRLRDLAPTDARPLGELGVGVARAARSSA